MEMLVSPQFPTAPNTNHWVALSFTRQPVNYTVYQRNSLAPSATWVTATNTTTSTVNLPVDLSSHGLFYKASATLLPSQRLDVQWNTVNDPGVIGYKVYYGSVSHTYTNTTVLGIASSLTLSNFPAGQTFYFAVTAYNQLNQESDYSAEAVYTTPSSAASFSISIDMFPKIPTVVTLPATNVTATSAVLQGQVLNTGCDLPTTVFFYGTNDLSTDTNADWSSFIASGISTNTASVLLPNLVPNTVYYFSFAALNAAGMGQSPVSMKFTTQMGP